MLARNYPFLIDSILANYAFKHAPVGTIVWNMYIQYALLNLWGICVVASRYLVAVRYTIFPSQVSSKSNVSFYL